MSVEELRAFGDWRGCLFCVCVVWGQLVCLFFLIATFAFTTRGRGLTFNFAPSLFEHPSMSQGFNPPTRPHNAVKSVLSCPNVALSPPHVCHRRRTGLSSQVRTCSKKVVISFGAPTTGRTCPHMDCASTEICKTQFATTSRQETVLAARETTHISRSPGRPQRANARMKPEVIKLATITPQMRKLLAHACETRV